MYFNSNLKTYFHSKGTERQHNTAEKNSVIIIGLSKKEQHSQKTYNFYAISNMDTNIIVLE